MPDEKNAADIFSETGRAIYDDADDWQSRLAAALDVTRETVRNIRRGNMVIEPDHGILTDLMALAERRAVDTVRARDALKAWLKKHRT